MTDTILKEFADLPDGPLHYIVDAVCFTNLFTVHVKGDTRTWDYVIPMSEIHIVLKYFSDAGYIADRIAF